MRIVSSYQFVQKNYADKDTDIFPVLKYIMYFCKIHHRSSCGARFRLQVCVGLGAERFSIAGRHGACGAFSGVGKYTYIRDFDEDEKAINDDCGVADDPHGQRTV